MISVGNWILAVLEKKKKKKNSPAFPPRIDWLIDCSAASHFSNRFSKLPLKCNWRPNSTTLHSLVLAVTTISTNCLYRLGEGWLQSCKPLMHAYLHLQLMMCIVCTHDCWPSTLCSIFSATYQLEIYVHELSIWLASFLGLPRSSLIACSTAKLDGGKGLGMRQQSIMTSTCPWCRSVT